MDATAHTPLVLIVVAFEAFEVRVEGRVLLLAQAHVGFQRVEVLKHLFRVVANEFCFRPAAHAQCKSINALAMYCWIGHV